jgi:glyoxylase-like metal-dependent hydrolase (beta-lactamase superfamily II)
MNSTTRRDILKMGSGLVGGAAFAGLLAPRAGAAVGLRPGESQQQAQQSGTQQQAPVAAPVSNDRVAQMRAQAATVPIKTTKLRENIYLLTGPGGNMVALTGSEGKVLVDTSFAGSVPKIIAALGEIDPQPLKVIINTHWHFDHTDGNAGLRQTGATIIAHENTLKRLSTPQDIPVFQMHFDAMPPAAWPRQTFNDQFGLHFGGERLDMAHILPAHTDSDIYVSYEKGNVLHCGDVWFNGIYPFIDPSSGGNINGMIAGAAECLKHADAETIIIPGHGPQGNKAQLTKYHDMMVTVRDRVQTQKAAGKKVEEVVAAKPTADLDAEWGKGNVTGDFFTTLVYLTL